MNQIWFMLNYSHEPNIVNLYCKHYLYEPKKSVNQEYGSLISKFAWTKAVLANKSLKSSLHWYHISTIGNCRIFFSYNWVYVQIDRKILCISKRFWWNSWIFLAYKGIGLFLSCHLDLHGIYIQFDTQFSSFSKCFWINPRIFFGIKRY